MVQRVYRGHLGRRKYKLRYDVIWAQKAEKWALVLQAGYRGMKGFVRKPCSNFSDICDHHDAFLSVHRVAKIV